VTPQDPGDPRCPSCGGAEWQRGARHVVIAPITGEAVTFRHQSAPHGGWTCHQCGYVLDGPGESTDVLEAVTRPWSDVSAD
jgi:rubredoxin